MKQFLIIPFAVLSFMVAGCQTKQQKMQQEQMKETFYWSPGISIVRIYPMEPYHCDFIFADSSSVGPANPGMYGGDWGEETGISVVGDEYKPVPVRFDVTWLSYTENRFYKGSFNLPYDTMLHLFKKGYDELLWDLDKKVDFLKHRTYSTIIAGLAPGGMVVLWLRGAGHQVEVGRFQATETTVDMKSFMQRSDVSTTKEAYIKAMMNGEKEVTDNLAQKGLQLGLWDRYRQKFKWRPVMEAVPLTSTSLGYVLHEARSEFYNGEKDVMDSVQLKSGTYLQQPRVRSIQISWTSGDGVEYSSLITMDEDDLFAAYKEIYNKENIEQEAELVVRVSKWNDQIHMFLRCKENEVELEKAKIETYK